MPLIGVGGIANADDAWERIRAGASLVQLYTAMVYEGPGIARRIALGLAERLKREGFANIAEAVGTRASASRMRLRLLASIAGARLARRLRHPNRFRRRRATQGWSAPPIRARPMPGAQMLRQGGTAADAAFATLLALTVVEPQSSGIGGGGYLVYSERGGAAGDLRRPRDRAAAATANLVLQGRASRCRFPTRSRAGRASACRATSG